MLRHDPGCLEYLFTIIPVHVRDHIGHFYPPQRQEIHRDNVDTIVIAQFTRYSQIHAAVVHIVGSPNQDNTEFILFFQGLQSLPSLFQEPLLELRLRSVSHIYCFSDMLLLDTKRLEE